jgi:ubiquinone/menaquinone biosynthesis C-methylase UbiE
MRLVPPQTNREELLDRNFGTLAEVRRSLHDIRRINRYLGGARVVCHPALSMLKQRGLRAATILDIGTGCADLPLRLQHDARRAGIDVRVIGLDINARHLRIAREDLRAARVLAATKNIQLLRADAFRLPLKDNSVDVVISSLFLHHFRAPQIAELLREFDRVSRVGFVMNDLVRHNIPLYFFRLTRPLFARSYLTRHDGEASLRRGYTVAEMEKIVAKSGISHARVAAHFPFRLSVTREKS